MTKGPLTPEMVLLKIKMNERCEYWIFLKRFLDTNIYSVNRSYLMMLLVDKMMKVMCQVHLASLPDIDSPKIHSFFNVLLSFASLDSLIDNPTNLPIFKTWSDGIILHNTNLI